MAFRNIRNRPRVKIATPVVSSERPKIVVHRATDALLVVDAQPTFMPGGGLPVKGGDEIVPVIRKDLLQLPYIPNMTAWRSLFDKERCIATIDRHPRGHVSLASSFIGAKPYDELQLDHYKENPYEFMVVRRGPWSQVKRGKIAPHAKFTKRELVAYLKIVKSQNLWPDHGIAGTDEAELHPELRESNCFGYVLVKGLDPCCDSYSGFKDNRGRLTELADVLRDRGVKRVFGCGLAEDFCVGWSLLDAVELSFEAVLLEDATRAVNIPGTKRKLGSLDTILKKFKKAGVVIARTTDLVAA